METDALLKKIASASSSPPLPRYGSARVQAPCFNANVSHWSESSRTPVHTSSPSLHTNYHGPVIPLSTDTRFNRRTIVLCFDGTGDQFNLKNSNVISFYSLLKKGDLQRQLVYYHSGIGTYTVPQASSILSSNVSKFLDLGLAFDLHFHIMDGYRFLMQNYKDGDKICIFGFSRGAYTARCLAGMLNKVGLLPAGNSQQVPFAYDIYKEDNKLGWEQSVAFKRAFCIDVDIDFVGVWDTVASIGIVTRDLPFAKSNTAIKVFRHALSLDERRIKFTPSLYQRLARHEAELGDFKRPDSYRNLSSEDGESCQTPIEEEGLEEREGRLKVSGVLGNLNYTFRRVVRSISRTRHNEETSDEDTYNTNDEDEILYSAEGLSPDSQRELLEQMYQERSKLTDVSEVWFAGCHCDVGGGAVSNRMKHSLARIPLRWMIRECFRAKTGIQFETDLLREIGVDWRTLYPEVADPASVNERASPSAPRREKEKQVGERRPEHENDASRETTVDVLMTASRSGSGEVISVETHIGRKDGTAESETSKQSVSKSWKTLRTVLDTKFNLTPSPPVSVLLERENQENALDLRQPVHDELKLNKWWWIVEYLPMRERVRREDGTHKWEWRVNRGRPRRILHNEPLKVHSSVKTRMEKLGRFPLIELGQDTIWVD